MSDAAGLKNFRVNSFSVVSHAQPELARAITDFYLDAPRLRMEERISDRLDGNLVKLVGEEGSQPPRCALDVDVKLGRRRLGLLGRELLGTPADRRFQIRALVYRGA